jgi:hypothetical protein
VWLVFLFLNHEGVKKEKGSEEQILRKKVKRLSMYKIFSANNDHVLLLLLLLLHSHPPAASLTHLPHPSPQHPTTTCPVMAMSTSRSMQILTGR